MWRDSGDQKHRSECITHIPPKLWGTWSVQKKRQKAFRRSKADTKKKGQHHVMWNNKPKATERGWGGGRKEKWNSNAWLILERVILKTHPFWIGTTNTPIVHWSLWSCRSSSPKTSIYLKFDVPCEHNVSCPLFIITHKRTQKPPIIDFFSYKLQFQTALPNIYGNLHCPSPSSSSLSHVPQIKNNKNTTPKPKQWHCVSFLLGLEATWLNLCLIDHFFR